MPGNFRVVTGKCYICATTCVSGQGLQRKLEREVVIIGIQSALAPRYVKTDEHENYIL